MRCCAAKLSVLDASVSETLAPSLRSITALAAVAPSIHAGSLANGDCWSSSVGLQCLGRKGPDAHKVGRDPLSRSAARGLLHLCFVQLPGVPQRVPVPQSATSPARTGRCAPPPYAGAS